MPCVESMATAAGSISKADLSEEQTDDQQCSDLHLGRCPPREYENDENDLEREDCTSDQAVDLDRRTEGEVLPRKDGLDEHAGNDEGGKNE